MRKISPPLSFEDKLSYVGKALIYVFDKRKYTGVDYIDIQHTLSCGYGNDSAVEAEEPEIRNCLTEFQRRGFLRLNDFSFQVEKENVDLEKIAEYRRSLQKEEK